MLRLLIVVLTVISSFSVSANDEGIADLIKKIDKRFNENVESDFFLNQGEELESQIPVGEPLFFSLFIEKNYLGELYGVKSEKGSLIELLSLVETLGFAINVEGTKAEGWFYSDENYVQINTLENGEFELLLRGERWNVRENDIKIIDDYLYMETSLIEQLFELKFTPDYRLQRVNLVASGRIPALEKLKRRGKTVSEYSANSPSIMPWKESPYQSVSSPVADVQLNAQHSNENTRLSYSVLGAFDLAFSNFEYYLTGDDNDLLTDSRATFTKESISNDLLGPLKGSKLSFGDLIASKVGLNQKGDYSRGIQLTNAPLFQQLENNKVTISGVVQNGWDVELYRNGLLLGQQVGISSGRYLFENIELLFGNNDFELILYGPQGQVERKQEQFIVDGTSLDKGMSVYDVSVSQVGHRLLDTRDKIEREAGWLYNGRYEYGVSDNVSLRTGISYFSADDGFSDDTRYALGADLKLFNKWLANFDYERNDKDEEDLTFTLRGEALSQSIRASATSRSYEKELTNELVEQNQFQVEAQGSKSFGYFGSLSYQNTVNYDDLGDSSRGSFRNLLNYRYGGMSISNNFEFTKNFDENSNFSLGSTRFQKRFGKIYSRFTVNYQIKPDWEVSSYEAELSRSFSDAWQAEFTYRELPIIDKSESEIGVSWQNDKLSLNANAKYDSDDDFQVGMFMRFSMGYSLDNNVHFMSKRNFAQSGTVMVKVFHDINNNGKFDEGELPLENIKVKALQNYRNNVTDDNGVAVLAGLTNNVKTDIVVDKESIVDGFMMPSIEGVAITPRRGFAEYIEFPVVNVSELDGTVYIAKQDGEDVAPYATVNLIDDQGTVVDQVKAEYDGYYVFTDVKPGEYDIQVENSFSDNKGLKEKHATKVRLSSKGDVVSEVNMTLIEKTLSSGFVMELGVFSSFQLMTVYAKLIKNQVSEFIIDNMFYIKRNGRFILASGFSKENKEGFEKNCKQINSLGLDCQVFDVEIKH